MITKEKEELLINIANDLYKEYDLETVANVTSIIEKNLHDYEVLPKSTELVVQDPYSERVLKIFIGARRLDGLSEKSLKQYFREYKLLLACVQKPVNKITKDEIRYYLMSSKMDRNLAEVTVENMRSYLSAIFSWLAAEKYIDSNPCETINPFKVPQVMKESFSAEDLNKIRDAAAASSNPVRNAALVEMLYSTGCRISELISIDIKDIDWDRKSIIVTGKGNKQRYVYLTDSAIEKIKLYLDTRKDEDPALFLSRLKKRITKSTVENMLKGLEKTSKVDNIHPHRFRRTLATDLLNNGMPIQDVSKILGHASIAITQKYYYHTDEKVKEQYNNYMK